MRHSYLCHLLIYFTISTQALFGEESQRWSSRDNCIYYSVRTLTTCVTHTCVTFLFISPFQRRRCSVKNRNGGRAVTTATTSVTERRRRRRTVRDRSPRKLTHSATTKLSSGRAQCAALPYVIHFSRISDRTMQRCLLSLSCSQHSTSITQLMLSLR
jgi:hypothetical protein